jgi:hypothetical protein
MFVEIYGRQYGKNDPFEQLLGGFLKEIGSSEQRPENLGALIECLVF